MNGERCRGVGTGRVTSGGLGPISVGGEGRECESMNEKCRAPLPPAQRLRAVAAGSRLDVGSPYLLLIFWLMNCRSLVMRVHWAYPEPGLEHDAILIYSRACPGCPGLLTSTGGHSQAAEDTGTCPPCPLHCGPLAGEERKAGRIGKFFTKKKKRKKKSRQPQEICVNCL
ncbi:uncharacterized protein LOC144247745 [Lonchura striata]